MKTSQSFEVVVAFSSPSRFLFTRRAPWLAGAAVGAEPHNVNIPRGGQVCRPGQVRDLDVQLGISVGASSVDADDAACSGNTAVGGHVVGFAARKWPEGEKQNQDGDAIHICLKYSRAGAGRAKSRRMRFCTHHEHLSSTLLEISDRFRCFAFWRRRLRILLTLMQAHRVVPRSSQISTGPTAAQDATCFSLRVRDELTHKVRVHFETDCARIYPVSLG